MATSKKASRQKATKASTPTKASTATKAPAASKAATPGRSLLKLRAEYKVTPEEEERVHVLRPGIVCDTEPRGHATPQGRSPLEIVLDASEGFIPLWAANTTLHWRFRERSLLMFENPEAIKDHVRNLLGESLMAWGTAAPVKFTEDEDVWDFEIIVRTTDDCTPSGCVLASAFFPDAGRHDITIYPMMFEQTYEEQVETMAHEIGHIFGLRHFFADVEETTWPVEIFGTHDKFSIMNYGNLSRLTNADRDDLTRLYQLVWNGAITEVNGTPIKLMKPFSSLAGTENAVAVLQPVLQPAAKVGYVK